MSLPSTANKLLRSLPSVEVLADRATDVQHGLAIAAARLEVDKLRGRILAGREVDLSEAALLSGLRDRARELSTSHLRPVINATGVILHTNLGRAPLALAAAEAAALASASYTNLEYDLEVGGRGSRQAHVEGPLVRLSGAQAAMAVNNNAAATLLCLASLGGGEVIVSRGQLIEIGGSFRIPEILAQSGLTLVEVGTTNRTRLADYEHAIGPDTVALLRVHQSNFHLVGFTEEVALAELCRLGVAHGLAIIDDLGSGALEPVGEEPTVRASVEAGATLICASADKLLGGPQAGLIFGRTEALARARAHPLARVVRLDKMQLAALETTLSLWEWGPQSEIPTVAMLNASAQMLAEQASMIVDGIGARARLIEGVSRPGGGSLPALELKGPCCAVDPSPQGAERLAERLREGDPPVIARIHDGLVLLDPRTIFTADLGSVVEATRAALTAR